MSRFDGMKSKVHAEVWGVSTRVGSLEPVALSLARPWLYIVSRWMDVAMVNETYDVLLSHPNDTLN